MKKFWIITGIWVVVIAFYASGIFKSESPKNQLAACYHGQVGDSDSVFTIESQKGKEVSGAMAFVFAQKDSSHGTFRGTFENGLLSVAYTFWSEGVQSVGDYQFKKEGKNFKGSGYTYSPANNCQEFLK